MIFRLSIKFMPLWKYFSKKTLIKSLELGMKRLKNLYNSGKFLYSYSEFSDFLKEFLLFIFNFKKSFLFLKTLSFTYLILRISLITSENSFITSEISEYIRVFQSFPELLRFLFQTFPEKIKLAHEVLFRVLVTFP